MNFEIAQPNEGDAHQVMEWRNDPLTLQGAYHQQPKVFEQFFEEYQIYFAFPELPPLFAMFEGKRVAFLRFEPVADPLDVQRRCCEISIIVAPNYRGRGFGSTCLSAIKPWLRQQGFDDLYAEVKSNNIISQKTFEKAGYSKLIDGVKCIADTGEEVGICRYLSILSEKSAPMSQPVHIIAEAGSNWRMGSSSRDRKMALTLIDIAAAAGADAIKFQLFRPETLYVPNAGNSKYLAESGINEEMHALFEDLTMPLEMVEELYTFCLQANIEFMVTPFSPADFTAVDPFVCRHKIASYEIGHIHLLKLAARSGKPLLLSTGAATPDEIAWAVSTFRCNGGTDMTLLQCTACYPAAPTSMHLRVIPWLKTRFGTKAGLSDHSRHPTCAPIAAVALGAKVIEKHFTLDNRLPGPDHSYALMPKELKEMVTAIRQAEEMLGSPIKIIDESEEELRAFVSRGLQAICDIAKGDKFIEDVNVSILRPGQQTKGIHPKFLKQLVGKRSKRNISLGDGIRHEDYS